MSCGLALALTLAVTPAAEAPSPAPAAAVAAPPSVAHEPLYADIVSRAQRLEQRVVAWRTADLKGSRQPLPLPGFEAFKAEAAQLAELDMQGHRDLAARNTDGDLKCILRGISEDLPGKIAAVEGAATGAAQDQALDELRYLLNDNAGVILAPPKPPV